MIKNNGDNHSTMYQLEVVTYNYYYSYGLLLMTLPEQLKVVDLMMRELFTVGFKNILVYNFVIYKLIQHFLQQESFRVCLISQSCITPPRTGAGTAVARFLRSL